MRCINCNNEIPDGVTVCPVCNANVQGDNTQTVPTDTSVLPTVPESPVLPQDQNMTVNNGNMVNPVETGNLENSTGVVNGVSGQQVTVTSQVPTMGENVAVNNGQIPVIDNNVVNQGAVETNNFSNQPGAENITLNGGVTSVSNGVAQVSSQVPNAQNSLQGEAQVSQPQGNQGVIDNMQTTMQTPNPGELQTGVQNPQEQVQVTNAINPEFIAPNGEAVKLGSTLSSEDKKKKNKKNLIIILVIVIVFAIVGVLGFLYYSSQYKSADKRISAVISALTMGTKSITNDRIEKSSGAYDIDFSISSTDTNLAAKLNGNYAIDLCSKAIDYTFNLTSLNFGEELIDNPINLEVYLNESRMYVLFQNYYENYIYDEIEGLSTIFDVNEQNNVDYISMINALKSALSNGFKSMHSTQTVSDITIHGESKKSNIVRINFNESNRKIFFRQFFKSLANNKKFVSEAAKFVEMSDDEFKKQLEEIDYDSMAANMGDATIEICTAMFGEKLDGIRVRSKVDEEFAITEIFPTASGYGLSYKVGSQNVLDLTYENTKKKTSTTRENNTKIGAVVYADGQAYNINLILSEVQDVNPKDAKVNVKNSINKKYLTEEEKQKITTASQSAGKIGLYLPMIINLYLNDGSLNFGTDFSGETGVTSPEEGGIPENDVTGVPDCTTDPSLCL